jgi:serine protease AprX
MEGTLSHAFGKAVWGAAVMLVLSGPAVAPGHGGGARASAKLDSVLARRGSSGGSLRVIVTIKPGTKASVRRRAEAHGGRILKDHSLVNALSMRVDREGLASLVSDPDVQFISTDADVAPSGGPAKNKKSSGSDSTPPPTTTTYTSSVVSELKKALGIGNWLTGSSVTIAVIDSGLAPTPDFTGRLIGTYDFTNAQGGKLIDASDEYGHGTHVAGLIGASGAVSAGAYAGVASGINFLSLRVLDKNGAGKTSDVIAALQFAVANKDQFNIRVVNLSLGHPIYESAATDPLVQAVEAAVRAGIAVVVAAGNQGINPNTGLPGYAGIASPGNSPSAITVGASVTNNTVVRGDDRVAPFSSRGPSWYDGLAKPDVVAPGAGLLSDEADGSTLSELYPSLVFPSTSGKLMKLSGSSMATGVVSGLVAIMIEAHDYGAYQRYQSSGTYTYKMTTAYVAPPPLTPNAIKAMLQYSATPLRDASGARFDVLTQGAGEVDGLGALTLAYLADTSQPAGAAWMPAVPPVTQFGDTPETWSQAIVWGTALVSGTGLIDVNQAAWQPSVVWGSGQFENIVWGTMADRENIVWGTALQSSAVVWAGSILEGDNIVWGTALSDWGENIVWGTALLGSFDGENIVWGTMLDHENIVWGTLDDENIVWGTSNRVTSLGLVGGVL